MTHEFLLWNETRYFDKKLFKLFRVASVAENRHPEAFRRKVKSEAMKYKAIYVRVVKNKNDEYACYARGCLSKSVKEINEEQIKS